MSVAVNQHVHTALPSSPVVPSNTLTHTLASMLGVTLLNMYAFVSAQGVIPPNAYAFPLVPPFASMSGITFLNGPIPPFHYFPLASVVTVSMPTVPGVFLLPASHIMDLSYLSVT
jgi:hypothetical protein